MSESEETSVDTETQEMDVEKEKSQNWKAFGVEEPEDKGQPEEKKKPKSKKIGLWKKLLDGRLEDRVPLYVKCRVCSGVYKRAVKTPCCGYRACRACAVKQATKFKKCWNKKCEKPLATTELENDDEQREKVEKYQERIKKWEEGLKTGNLLKCSICEETCKRGISMSCCGIAACRGCAVKKLTAKRECWIETCSAVGISSDTLENDELLRTAVEHFKEHGEMDLDHAKKISANRAKLNPQKKNEKKKTNQKKTRRQPPKNKKEKKPTDKKTAPVAKPTEKTTKPAQKKKPLAKKQDQKPKPLMKINPRQGRQNNFRQRVWPSGPRNGMGPGPRNGMGPGPRNGMGPGPRNGMGPGPWLQSPMGGMNAQRLAEENMQMKNMLMRMNNMGNNRMNNGGYAGNIWQNGGMGGRNMNGGTFNDYGSMMRRF